MSVIKLTSDSTQPPVTSGKVQLFGSDFSPYSQCVHMTLIAKDVPYEMFDVNFLHKPSWYATMQPEEKHPVLRLDDGNVLLHEKDILKYLQEKFPSQTDPGLRERNIELLKKFKAVVENFSTAIRNKDFKPAGQSREFFKAFEEELQKRGTTFLGGETPGMVDCAIWPWFERFRVPPMLHGIDHKPPPDRTPGKITAWKEAMEKTKAVTQTAHTLEEHVINLKRYMQK